MPQELLILSPEKTVLSFNIARLASRVFAQLLDVLIIVVSIFAITMIIGLITAALGMTFGDPKTVGTLASSVVLLFISFFPFLYFILFEGFWNGLTPGKKATGIRVRMADGTPITFSAAVSRNLLRVADFLPGTYFVGLLAMFTNKKAQRLGDMIAQTIVTHERKPVPLFTPAPYILGIHAFEDHVGDLRAMSTEDYNALKRMCDRFPDLPTAVQSRMMAEVWLPFAERFKIEPIPNVYPVYLAEAVVMKYGRAHGLL
ncbi:MAG TPA: RDD family protein [Fimbriimonadaceae bacterium]|jgi:uncharacterized RDD family membrane protein YckC